MGPRAEASAEVQRQRDAEWSAACDAAEDILNDCIGLSPTAAIPFSAIQKFEDLARGVTFTYRLWSFQHPDGPDAARAVYEDVHQQDYISLLPFLGPDNIGRSPTHIGMNTPSERGELVKALIDYFLNPSRDRLRRCEKCRRWFVDETRNKSQRRCSVKCTRAWWNRGRRRDSLVHAGRWPKPRKGEKPK